MTIAIGLLVGKTSNNYYLVVCVHHLRKGGKLGCSYCECVRVELVSCVCTRPHKPATSLESENYMRGVLLPNPSTKTTTLMGGANVNKALEILVKWLYCKRPIQCLTSSKILTPLPPGECALCTPRLWCGWRTHSLRERGWGVIILVFWKTPDTACSVHYIRKYFVTILIIFVSLHVNYTS